MISVLKYASLVFSAFLLGLAGYIFWPAPYVPVPAPSALKQGASELVPLALDRDKIYGVALTYPGIIQQGGYDYDPRTPPPIFRKLSPALTRGREVHYPTQTEILDQIEKLEPGLAGQLRGKFQTLPVLMDYEVELGIVVLEDIAAHQIDDPTFAPKLGYFLANDLQSMTLGILGFETERQASFLDQKGSFPGFLPVSKSMWVPQVQGPDSLLCIDLQTRINGEMRQNQNTVNRIYTNKQILGFVAETYGLKVITSGTAIITGSPSGVANSTPRWKKRLGKLLGMDRFDKISAVAFADKDQGRFLQPGDTVIVHAPPLESIETLITE